MKLSFLNFNKQYQVVIASLLVAVVLGVAQPFLWRLVRDRSIALHDSRSQSQQIVNVKDRNASIRHNLSEERELLSQLDVVVPPKRSLTQVVERLEQLADQRQLRVKITNLKEELASADSADDATLLPVTATLAVEGTIDQALDYMSSIEHIQELSFLTSWSIVPRAASGSAPVAPGVSPLPTQPPVYTLSANIIFYLRGGSNEPAK